MPEFLNPTARGPIEERMRRGGYASADDVVAAALAALEQDERFGDFGPGELNALLAEGEAGGEFLDGAKALAAPRRRRTGHGQSEPPAKSA